MPAVAVGQPMQFCTYRRAGAYKERAKQGEATCEILRRLFRVHLPRPLFGNAGGHAHQVQVVELAAYTGIIIFYFANHVIEKVKEMLNSVFNLI